MKIVLRNFAPKLGFENDGDPAFSCLLVCVFFIAYLFVCLFVLVVVCSLLFISLFVSCCCLLSYLSFRFCTDQEKNFLCHSVDF